MTDQKKRAGRQAEYRLYKAVVQRHGQDTGNQGRMLKVAADMNTLPKLKHNKIREVIQNTRKL